MSLKPSDVFVPYSFPTEKSNAYADRGRPQSDLEKELQRGSVPLVFGPYGVGKSSLALHVTKEVNSESRLVYIPSVAEKSFEDIQKLILEHLGYEVVKEKSSKGIQGGTVSNEASVEAGGLVGFLRATWKGTFGRSWSKEASTIKELSVKSPTDEKIIKLCEMAKLVLIVDELHKASDEFNSDLAIFLKTYANLSCKMFRVCLLGTGNDAARLVRSDPGIDRLVIEIPLKALDDKEADQIIIPGMKLLGLTVGKEFSDRVFSASVGAPSIVQYLCLEAAELALGESSDEVNLTHYEKAVKSYTEKKAQRAIRTYRSAIETIGDVKYRKCILHAIADIDDDYVTMEMLVDQVTKNLGKPIKNTALSGPLRELKTAKYDKILSDIEKPNAHERIHNYSTFTDPAVKSVIRMIAKLKLTV